MQQSRPIYRALLSVFSKKNIVKFAQELSKRGVMLLATNGTARFLLEKGLQVTKVSDYIDFPEIMDGRLKTLHPRVYGGILGRRGRDEDIMEQYEIISIDMVVVNFYPFSQIITHKESSLEDIMENIDVGGPTLARSAAKNYKDVAIVVKESDYNFIINEMEVNRGSLTLDTRLNLAMKAFEYIASYDSIISNYFNTLVTSYHNESQNLSDRFPRVLNLNFIKKQNLCYGENEHQQAAFYVEEKAKEVSISTSQQIQGKTLSYNNIVDSDTALECVKSFNEPACVIVKHTNPCGVAVSTSILEAYNRAYKTDPTSAFGGIIAFNRKLDEQTAQAIISRQFVEVIIAPSVSKEALKIVSTKQNVRILIFGQYVKYTSVPNFDFKQVNGGLLVQDRNLKIVVESNLDVVTKRQPTNQEWCDSLFCWKVVKFVKSNAIVYAKENMTIGIGAGQMSRIYSAKIASIKAADEGLEIKGSVMASDAFLPFRDSIDVAASIGITCVIQPGGSIRDNEVIYAANEHGMTMIFTKIRNFRH